MTLAGQMVGKRRAEESRGSGNEKVHRLGIILSIFALLFD
jgi:hypothetical protein